jgi:hypothetical protein
MQGTATIDKGKVGFGESAVGAGAVRKRSVLYTRESAHGCNAAWIEQSYRRT